MTAPSIRPYRSSDEDAVLRLIAADRIPGQPRVGRAMLGEALAGRSPVDGGFWAELNPPVTEVLVGAGGEVRGVVSYAWRSCDATGVILWLYCAEREEVAAELIQRAVDQLGGCCIDAFDFATALGRGLEALPVGHRPATHHALTAAGFVAEHGWRYFRATLPLPALPVADDAEICAGEDQISTRLEIRHDGELVAEAVIGDPVDGIGVLWWIEVVPAMRRRGLGAALLGTALQLLAARGADQVILYVDDDDDAPAGAPRDRTAAKLLYARAGFREVDRLWSYHLRRQAACVIRPPRCTRS